MRDVTLWKKTQINQKWGKVDGPKKGRHYEFGVKSDKKVFFQFLSKVRWKYVEECNDIEKRRSKMFSSSSIHEIDNLFWKKKMSASISKNTLWKGEEIKLSKKDKKNKMWGTILTKKD